MTLVTREKYDIPIAAGSPDYTVYIRPCTIADNSTSFVFYGSSFFTNMVQDAANYYDLVSFPEVRVEFVPGFHTSSTHLSFTRNQVAYTYLATLPSAGTGLDQFGSLSSYGPSQTFSVKWSPKEKAKQIGVPTWIDTVKLASSTTANYSNPATLLMFFAAPQGGLPNSFTAMGNIFVQCVYTFRGRNA